MFGHQLFAYGALQVSRMSVGKKVRVLNDEEKVRLLQKGHGGYNAEMRSVGSKIKMSAVDFSYFRLKTLLLGLNIYENFTLESD